MSGLMMACSLIAILTTLGIVLSLLFEALRFFERVSPLEFFFGLSWEPQIPIREGQVTAGGAFGAIPVFTGTLLISAIAMLVAIPIGLYSAIYLTEYAHPRFRAVVKPLLELLAGIPTVVYGFFAVLAVAPAMRNFGEMIGVPIAPNSALAAGRVMGIMIIPFVSSLSDDAIAAVPRAMRDGSYAMGATKGETITKVLLPAALPGHHGRRPARRQPRHRRDHDRGDGRRHHRLADRQSARAGHHRDGADRDAAHRRHRVRQPEDARRLRARPRAVPA